MLQILEFVCQGKKDHHLAQRASHVRYAEYLVIANKPFPVPLHLALKRIHDPVGQSIHAFELPLPFKKSVDSESEHKAQEKTCAHEREDKSLE
jgi:hypothetical protein